MRRFLGTFLSILLVTSVAMAADRKPNPQQERMNARNGEAGEKKLAGDEREGVHVELPERRGPHADDPAGKDEGVQQGSRREGVEGGRAEEVHERMLEQ